MRENLYGRSREELARVLEPLTGRPFHAHQLYRWMHGQGECDFGRMTNLPKSLRKTLEEEYRVERPRIRRKQRSRDGTIKYLLTLEDGKAMESVSIPEGNRLTFCISSQIGCPLACTFCLTGKMGLVRNLTPGEIVGQVSHLASELEVGTNQFNLVFMGMGEPLNNYDNVLNAFRILTDPEGFGIAPKHITLSTAGVVPGLKRLAQEPTRPRIAVSLSATTNKVRDELMPINKAFPLSVLFAALREIRLAARERVTLEYVLLNGINDSSADADRLATLTERLPVKINLIPYNDAAVEEYAPPPAERVRAFRDLLLARGIRVSVRKRKGADISAACGQLAILKDISSRSRETISH